MPVSNPQVPAHGHIPFGRVLWRFFTGAHMDGEIRTDAGWFKPGSANHRNATWWTIKPRFHRMLWRVIPVAAIVGWLTAYHYAPTVRGNGMVVLTIMALPFLFHRAVIYISRRIPRTRVVMVTPHEPLDHSVMDSEQWGTVEESDIEDLTETAFPPIGTVMDPPERNRRR